MIKNYLKNKKQHQFNNQICPSCKRNIWLEIDKGYYCKNCEYIINKQKHQIDKKVRRQYHYFSTRLPYADEKLEKYMFLWLILFIFHQKVWSINYNC